MAKKMELLRVNIILIIISLSMKVFPVMAQETPQKDATRQEIILTDTTQQKVRSLKNTIRFNITNPFIFGEKALIFGYERTIGTHQSFSVNIGRAYYPQMISGPSEEVQLSKESQDNGINFSLDYRFFLQKENKFAAPRGVYIGPYYSYNHFNRTNTWKLNTTDFQGNVGGDLTVDINTLGMELGYQFVFWKRVSLDMILCGPGIASYRLTTKFDTTLSSDDLDLLYSKIENYLETKFPGYEFVKPPGEQTFQGTVKTWAAGFRYMIMVGFRF